MRIAYADPPYKGQAKKHYGSSAEEVNFPELIKSLSEYDSWALSVHQGQLKELLPICPPRTRVGIWVKPFAVFKKNVNPTYAWEPVLFKASSRGMKKRFVHDWVACSPQMKALVVGQKPMDFCFWLFEILNVTPYDEFFDIFPGSGNVQHCHSQFIKYYNDIEFKSLERLQGSVRDERDQLKKRSGLENSPAPEKGDE